MNAGNTGDGSRISNLPRPGTESTVTSSKLSLTEAAAAQESSKSTSKDPSFSRSAALVLLTSCLSDSESQNLSSVLKALARTMHKEYINYEEFIALGESRAGGVSGRFSGEFSGKGGGMGLGMFAVASVRHKRSKERFRNHIL